MLDFDLMVLTPWHFIEQMFATGVIVSRDQKIQRDNDITEKTMVKVRAYASFFCDIITEQYDIVAKYSPSKVAHACLYYARKCCQLREVWSTDFESYSSYSLESLKDILEDFGKCKEISTLADSAIRNFREKNAQVRSWEVKKLI